MSASFEELMKAKTLLGLHDRATLHDIKLRYKNLMQKWHPDKHPDDQKRATEMSARINAAYKLLLEYCKHYEYDFSETHLRENVRSPEEWWYDRFGGR